MPNPFPASSSLIFLGVTTAAALALYTTHSQLSSYARRASKTPTTPGVGVEQSTEDAIKLSTLAQLARGVNPELRHAALNIIIERATRPPSMQFILDQLEGHSQQRIVAIAALKYLSTLCPGKLAALPRLFQLLGRILMEPPVGGTERERRDVVEVLVVLGRKEEGRRRMVEGGLREWVEREVREGEQGGLEELRGVLAGERREAREGRVRANEYEEHLQALDPLGLGRNGEEGEGFFDFPM